MFKDLQVRYFIAGGLLVLGLVIAGLGYSSSHLLMWVGIGMVTVSVILFFTIRCPHCGHGLTGRGVLFLPEFCPKCGQKIFESDTQ